MKRILFFAMIFATIAYLLCFPAEAFAASADGLRLWFGTVLPSLLPFMILSDFLIHAGVIPRLLGHFERLSRHLLGLDAYGMYAFFLGLFCGYPMGARLTAELYTQKKITRKEAEYLLTFSNNASPMFLTSYVLTNTLQAPRYTIPTFAILWGSSIITSMIFRHHICRRQEEHSSGLKTPLPDYDGVSRTKKETSIGASIGHLIDVSIMNSFETITRLGGYIILFSIGVSILLQITAPVPWAGWILPGVVEITTGIRQIAASPLPFAVRYLLILCCAAFGGLSTMAQTKGMLAGTPLSLSHYIKGKLTQTTVTLFLGILFLIVIG